jgi:hypothetical protein
MRVRWFERLQRHSCERIVLHQEQLAVKTDKGPHYRTKDARALKAGELCPRSGEPSKSAWAFSIENGLDPATPSLELQAIAVLLLTAATILRSEVKGVAFLRAELADGQVTEDDGEHPIAGMNGTHRSLLSADAAIATDILQRCNFREWSFTRDQLRDSIQALLTSGSIIEKYRPFAHALLSAT